MQAPHTIHTRVCGRETLIPTKDHIQEKRPWECNFLVGSSFLNNTLHQTAKCNLKWICIKNCGHICIVGIEPGTSAWEARNQHLCHSAHMQYSDSILIVKWVPIYTIIHWRVQCSHTLNQLITLVLSLWLRLLLISCVVWSRDGLSQSANWIYCSVHTTMVLLSTVILSTVNHALFKYTHFL